MIQFKDVFKEYSNGTKALKGVSFTLRDGEFAFLVGPSGSGKSTLIKLITGEISPTSGANCRTSAGRWAWSSRISA